VCTEPSGSIVKPLPCLFAVLEITGVVSAVGVNLPAFPLRKIVEPESFVKLFLVVDVSTSAVAYFGPDGSLASVKLVCADAHHVLSVLKGRQNALGF